MNAGYARALTPINARLLQDLDDINVIMVKWYNSCVGGVLAILWDNLDTSFNSVDEIGDVVNLSVFATIPDLTTRGSVLAQRRSRGILVFTSIPALAVGLVCVRMFGPLYF